MHVLIGNRSFKAGIWFLIFFFVHMNVFAEDLKNSLIEDISKRKTNTILSLN